MTKHLLLLLCLLYIYVLPAFAQVDSLAVDNTAQVAIDTIPFSLDSSTIAVYAQYGNHQNFITATQAPVINDVQQYNSHQRNGFVFIVLLALLGILTYVKTAFSKYFEEMLQSVFDRNASQQIFRSRSGEISFADILLNANFVVVISLYARFFLLKYMHVASLENFSAILFLIFLFTFFYLAKLITLLFIGKIFELEQACEEYIFNFTTLCKTLGLTLLPALFVFYTASEKFFNIIFLITILFFVASAIIFIWRALSTAYKLMYRSVYHFFIYVCIVEISTMFLFIKLLTKTII